MQLFDLLSGLRVVDLTRHLPGPHATDLLSRLGAEVVKVEPPEGDPARALGDLFASLNAHKTLMKLDLRSEEGRNALKELLKTADVFMEGFRPGVLKTMGCDFEALKAINPRLVVCSITGYGQSGPWSAKAGHDLNFMAMSGCLDAMRDARGEIIMADVQWGDMAGGSHAVAGALAGVIRAQRTGRGCLVDVSMTHGVWTHLVMPNATHPQIEKSLGRALKPREDLWDGALPCYNLYQTQDGRSLALASVELKFWRGFCARIGRPEWSARHFMLGMAPNSPDSNALREEVAALIKTRSLAHWLELFAQDDICLTPVLTREEAKTHELFQTRQTPWTIID